MDEKLIELAEWTLSHDLYPEPVIPEYDPTDEIFPEAVRHAKRFGEYLDAQPVSIRDGAKFVGLMRFADDYFPGEIHQRRGFPYFSKTNKRYYCKPYNNYATCDWEHATADFGAVIQYGFEELYRQINVSRDAHAAEPEKLIFLQGEEMVLNAILRWAEKCALACEAKAAEEKDEARQNELYEMADILRRVPRYPARTFREAVQCLYLIFHFLVDSIGLPDRYLRPYYERDLAEGRLTREEAENYLGELYCMISASTPFTSGNADKGGESHFTIGGYLPDHTDGFCDLSRLLLDSMMKLPLVRPQVTVRWTPETPTEVLYHVLDCERHDKGKRIALCNDVPRIKAYMELTEMPFEEACRYVVVGCNEPAFEGSIDMTGALGNVGRTVSDVFTTGSKKVFDAVTFDEFYTEYERTLDAALTQIVQYLGMFNASRSRDVDVVSSPFITGCIERGVSMTQGGAKLATFSLSLCGYITAVDSLTVIRQFVFEEKKFTLRQLADMLAANWEGYEAQRAEILKRGHFFGNDDPDCAEIVERFNGSLRAFALKHRGIFGTRMLFGSYIGYQPHNSWFGELTGATPDGRKAGEIFVIGIGQMNGKDREGLTALLHSMSTAYADGIVNGTVVSNIMLDEALIANDDNFEKTVKLAESYFRSGGLMLQLNHVSREELLDARKNPDKYRSLRVRVSGFSAYFTRLNERLQEEIIARTSKSN